MLFVGNEYLNAITSRKQYRLRIELTSWNDQFRFAEYSNFKIADTSQKYKLSSLGTYSGNAGM